MQNTFRLLVLLALLWLPACATPPAVPGGSTQVLLCTTDAWQDATATLRCLELSPSGWQLAMPDIAVNVGENGLGWGLGLHASGDGPAKHEGDGRAPAGVFALGTAFGYAKTAPTGFMMPYRQATSRDYFVDGADSPVYNQWQRIPVSEINDPKRKWSSCERMRRDDALYELGMVVNHNMDPAVPGRGSAIFLHVWRGPNSPTSGCTSMARADLLRVLQWLRPQGRPVLVQVPVALVPHDLLALVQ